MEGQKIPKKDEYMIKMMILASVTDRERSEMQAYR